MEKSRSTGPRSVEGKAVSSRNALKSGIYAKSEVVLPYVNLDDLQTPHHRILRPFRPRRPRAALPSSTPSFPTSDCSAVSAPPKPNCSPAKCAWPTISIRNRLSARPMSAAPPPSNASSAASTLLAAIATAASNWSTNFRPNYRALGIDGTENRLVTSVGQIPQAAG